MMEIWDVKFIREMFQSILEQTLGPLIPSTSRGPFDAH